MVYFNSSIGGHTGSVWLSTGWGVFEPPVYHTNYSYTDYSYNHDYFDSIVNSNWFDNNVGVHFSFGTGNDGISSFYHVGGNYGFYSWGRAWDTMEWFAHSAGNAVVRGARALWNMMDSWVVDPFNPRSMRRYMDANTPEVGRTNPDTTDDIEDSDKDFESDNSTPSKKSSGSNPTSSTPQTTNPTTATVTKPKLADIKRKKEYNKRDARAIYKKAFKNVPTDVARQRFAELPKISYPITHDSMTKFARWYFFSQGVTDSNERKNGWNYAMNNGGLVKGKRSIRGFMNAIDKWISEGKKDPRPDIMKAEVDRYLSAIKKDRGYKGKIKVTKVPGSDPKKVIINVEVLNKGGVGLVKNVENFKQYKAYVEDVKVINPEAVKEFTAKLEEEKSNIEKKVKAIGDAHRDNADMEYDKENGVITITIKTGDGFSDKKLEGDIKKIKAIRKKNSDVVGGVTVKYEGDAVDLYIKKKAIPKIKRKFRKHKNLKGLKLEYKDKVLTLKGSLNPNIKESVIKTIVEPLVSNCPEVKVQ